MTTRILVVVAALCAATALGVVLWKSTCSTCGSQAVGEYVAVPYLNDEENSVAEHIWRDIYKPAAEKGVVGEEQIAELQSYLDPSQPYFVRDLSMGVMAELLHMDVELSGEAHETIVESFLMMLQDQEWGLRRAAVTNAQTAGLLQEPKIYDAVRAMSTDPRPEVANRVNRIDWTDPKNGG